MPILSAPGAVPSLLLVAVLASAGCLGSGSGHSSWAYDLVQLDELAAEGRDGGGVTVAFLDTGINVGHPSLDHLLDEDRENGELVAFRDFLGSANGASQAFDDDGHGTHVAGILAARGSSGLDRLGGIDLQGGAPGVLLAVARVCDGDSCDPSAIPGAINWAVAQGADVVSLSLGGTFGLVDVLQEAAIMQAVERAIDSGAVVIASAGNGGPGQEDPSKRTADVESPANISQVIAVGAVDRDGRVADFSSRGDPNANRCGGGIPLPGLGLQGRCPPDQKPEIVAPGVSILSAWTGNGYAEASGTSQATPFVTAAVALLLDGKADLAGAGDVQRLKQALVDTARPVPGQAEPHDPAAGYGLLQAQAAALAFG